MKIRSLSFHARYKCGRSGVCCSSQWPIPIEADRLARVQAALASAELRIDHDRPPFETSDDHAHDAPALLAIVDGCCALFDRSTRTCLVHRSLGHEALPLACRQFPRVVVTDPGGVSVVLSHYCPTAAGLLELSAQTQQRVCVVQDAAAFPATGEYVGLDARHTLPPLLTPDVLMDWESWWDFEERAVDWLGHFEGPVEAALGGLHSVVERIRTWRPGGGSLRDRIAIAFAHARGSSDWIDVTARVDDAIACIERDRLPPLRSASLPAPAVFARFLTAHAFANWTPHLGGGLRTWLRSLETAYALIVNGWTIGEADLILRHLADPRALARTWRAAEHAAAARV